MSVKKSMLIIWAVASLLWAGFSSYLFHLDDVIVANKLLRIYEARYLKEDRSRESRNRVQRARDRAAQYNKELCLFFIVGVGFPGLMLAVGTILLQNQEEAARRAKRRK